MEKISLFYCKGEKWSDWMECWVSWGSDGLDSLGLVKTDDYLTLFSISEFFGNYGSILQHSMKDMFLIPDSSVIGRMAEP